MTIYRLILTWEESWVLNNWFKSRLQATEVRFLRRVKRVTRIERNRNERIKMCYRLNDRRPVKCVGGLSSRKKKHRKTTKTWNMAVTNTLKKNI